MGRVKEELLKKEEKDWVDTVINNTVEKATANKIIYNDLFNMDDLTDFYMMELHLINGEKYYIYPEEIEEITSINIKWIEPTQLHKDDHITQVKALMSVPIAHIACMTVYYKV